MSNKSKEENNIGQMMADPELRGKLSAFRAKVHENAGQVILAMMALPRYRDQSLADLAHLVLDPLMHDRIAIAHIKAEEEAGGNDRVAGMAIWAGVSEEVDAKLSAQVKSGVFPVRLKNEEWASGDQLWLFDIIAPNRALATAVLANFRQIAGGNPVKIHPLVGKVVDGDVLEKLRISSEAAESADAVSEVSTPSLNS